MNNIEKTYISPEVDDSAKQILDNPRISYNDTRKTSVTKYRVLDSANQSALIELQPLTGDFKIINNIKKFIMYNCILKRLSASNKSSFSLWFGLSYTR